MPVSKKKNEINLIPVDKFAASSAGKILSWLLSTFRVIVIVVEMIVMLAFLSRFWLDAKNSDLNDEMKQKQALIAASKNFEDEFNATQDKISAFLALTTSAKSSNSLNDIPSVLPEGITLKSISISDTSILVDGESPSEGLIAQFIANLEGLDKYQGINLNQIGSNQDTGMITYKIDIQKKTEEKTKTK